MSKIPLGRSPFPTNLFLVIYIIIYNRYIQMQSSETLLKKTLQLILDKLKSQEARTCTEVLSYQKKLNNELTTLKQWTSTKPLPQVQKIQLVDKKKQEMSLKLEKMIGDFNNQINEMQQKPLQKGVRDKSSVKAPNKKQEPKQQPKKIEPLKIVKPKIQPYKLISFAKSPGEIEVRQKATQQINIKQWIKQYKDQELKNIQHQRKARLSYINTLAKYAPSRKKILRQYTDKRIIRGWKGCEYSSIFLNYLESISKDQLLKCCDPRTKVGQLYRWSLISKKLNQNWELLQQVKRQIIPPPKLNINLKFLQSKKQLAVSKGQQFIDLDQCLQPFYQKVQKVLSNFLSQGSLKKADLQLLVQICNVVLTKGKKCYTVIKYQQLQYFLSVIQNGPERY